VSLFKNVDKIHEKIKNNKSKIRIKDLEVYEELVNYLKTES
jgi:hypothetical protein